MSNDRLNSLILMYVHKDIKLDYVFKVQSKGDAVYKPLRRQVVNCCNFLLLHRAISTLVILFIDLLVVRCSCFIKRFNIGLRKMLQSK